MRKVSRYRGVAEMTALFFHWFAQIHATTSIPWQEQCARKRNLLALFAQRLRDGACSALNGEPRGRHVRGDQFAVVLETAFPPGPYPHR